MKAQKTFLISVPPRLSAEEVDTAIASLDGTYGEVSVMAASLGFATPLDMCGLRALVEHAACHADTVILDCPTSGDVHRYLARMDVYANLPPNVTLSVPVPSIRRRDRRQNLLELSHIRCGDDVQEFTARAYDVAKGHFGLGALANACATALGAATENVLDHATSPIGALAAAQRYQSVGLDLAVVDLGLGIPTTLRRNADYTGLSDMEAIEESLIDGVTSTGILGRGGGMSDLVTAIGRAGNSTMVIRSGNAHMTISARDGVAQRQRRTLARPVTGTWISVRLQS